MAVERDYIAELGALALASRLRRFLHRLQSDGEQVYQSLNLDFKPKWCPILHLLSNCSPLNLAEVAQLLGVAHPSVIETVNELVQAGLVESRQSEIDRRCRELFLSSEGKQLCNELQPVWNAFRAAGEEVVGEDGNSFLEALGKLEHSIDDRSMYERIMARLERRTGHKERDRDKHSKR
ncbi:MAG TPA: MarR family transcriptional regulator [Acidobacteriota bacterium]|nr:MarR family transcriptional regulator [Acidobacteriota bacterium]